MSLVRSGRLGASASAHTDATNCSTARSAAAGRPPGRIAELPQHPGVQRRGLDVRGPCRRRALRAVAGVGVVPSACDQRAVVAPPVVHPAVRAAKEAGEQVPLRRAGQAPLSRRAGHRLPGLLEHPGSPAARGRPRRPPICPWRLRVEPGTSSARRDRRRRRREFAEGPAVPRQRAAVGRVREDGLDPIWLHVACPRPGYALGVELR